MARKRGRGHRAYIIKNENSNNRGEKVSHSRNYGAKKGRGTALKKTLPHLLGSVVIIYYALKTVIGSISSPL